MKLRFSFRLKILLPFLALALLFIIIFQLQKEDGPILIRILLLSGIAACLIFAFLQFRWIRKDMRQTTRLLMRLRNGQTPDYKASGSGDETGDLEKAMEAHINRLRSIARFSRSVASGDFSEEFDTLGPGDEIGEALISLKTNLEDSARESEARRESDHQRTWTAQGLARFSKLFRESSDDLRELSSEFIKELVAYTAADVGALFISREGEKGKMELEMSGSFAFGREKYIHSVFEFGEGLVGRTALEKETVYLTDLPPETIKIRSGLGEDLPSSLLLVPVMFDEDVHGVIELASLQTFPDYQQDFIRQLGDALAGTLTKIEANRIALRQAGELSSQEVEFRQKLEALEKAHTESLQREKELQQEIQDLRKS